MNGSTPSSGLVQISVDDEVGNICYQSNFDKIAGLICRELNYSGGRTLPDSYSSVESKIYIRSIRCDKNATRLMDCMMKMGKSTDKVRGGYSYRRRWHYRFGEDRCWRRGSKKMAVQCYDKGLKQ